MNLFKVALLFVLLVLSGCNSTVDTSEENIKNSSVDILSLSDLSIDTLKKRPFESSFTPIKELHNLTTKNKYTEHFFNNATPYHSAIIGYESDGLSLYSRIDIPGGPAPKNGFPVVVFIHGWVGLANAKFYDFSYNTKSNYADVIHQFVQAGFVVLTPGLRGHGTVDGKIAEGTEFIETWDNGSYTSPLFYSIDVLNLLAGIKSIKSMSWFSDSLPQPNLAINSQNVNIFGHSQGGDMVLTTLAVTGENATISQTLNAGAIWAGCFLPRTEQLALYGPMASTTEAFLSGDNTWTASAVGKNGEINHNFIYPYPADWIGTPDNSKNAWTWQKKSWSTVSVKAALNKKLTQMYQTFNEHVSTINGASYYIESKKQQGINIVHDPKILKYLSAMDAFNYPQYLTEKIALHHSDRDYYSPSIWNEKLAKSINSIGGSAADYEYFGNTHSMAISSQEWFSPKGSNSGFKEMMKRNIALFSQ